MYLRIDGRLFSRYNQGILKNRMRETSRMF